MQVVCNGSSPASSLLPTFLPIKGLSKATELSLVGPTLLTASSCDFGKNSVLLEQKFATLPTHYLTLTIWESKCHRD